MAGPNAAVVVAAGSGSRAGAGLPKVYRPLAGMSAIRRSLALLDGTEAITLIQPVVRPGDLTFFHNEVVGLNVLAPVIGGATRQASVHAGLRALAPHRPARVLIHDAARPFASPALVARALTAPGPAAIPVVPVVDTIKQVAADGHVTNTIDRTSLRVVQTPQSFVFDALLAAHDKAATAGRTEFTDDAALMEWAGTSVTTFNGEPDNIKLTSADDFARAEARLLADVRTGQGFDVHAFGDGDHVMLGGIAIPHERGLSGHSDADVGLHALVDAVLGALADGDIGAHFPPSDPQWRGAASDRFLSFAVERVRARGGQIAHLDLTLVCEAPRVGPHRQAMRERIAEIAGIALERVAVKATTSERLGFTGRGEGIAALASATIRLPWSAP